MAGTPINYLGTAVIYLHECKLPKPVLTYREVAQMDLATAQREVVQRVNDAARIFVQLERAGKIVGDGERLALWLAYVAERQLQELWIPAPCPAATSQS